MSFETHNNDLPQESHYPFSAKAGAEKERNPVVLAPRLGSL